MTNKAYKPKLFVLSQLIILNWEILTKNLVTMKWGEVDRFWYFLKHNSRSTVLISSFL